MPATAPHLLSSLRCLWQADAALGEGCCWSVREQALYWVDILGHKLLRCDATGGQRREWTLPDTISAVAERRDAPGLVITLRRGLALFDPATGALTPQHEPEPERSGNRFNDGKCDAAGRFWGGTMDFDCSAPTGALYRFGPDGRGERAADLGWPVTNGPTWSLDGRTIFVNHSTAGEVWTWHFEPGTGSLSEPRLWLRFAADDGVPDGMTTDAQGRLWIAHWGAGCVSCHDPVDARELLRVPVPASQVTNIAFGGTDLRTLFITSARVGLGETQLAAEPLAGALFAIETDATGLPAHHYAG
jgi:sugar lactone lactonase YvrE